MADLVKRLHGPVREAASRLIAGAFRRDGERLEEDDDIVLIAALEEAADRIAALEAEASKGERRGMERAAEVANGRVLIHSDRQRSAYASGNDWMGEIHHARHVEAWEIGQAIRALIPEAPVRDNK